MGNPNHQRSITFPFVLLAALFVASIIIPLAAIALHAMAMPHELKTTVMDSSVRGAILLSLEAGAITALISGLLGIPLAWLLSRFRFPGRGLVQTIVDLPLTVPHVVAGIAILLVYGRNGVLGAPLHELLDLNFWGSLPGIVAAMFFVSAPYTVSAGQIAFDGVNPRYENVARSLGIGPWRTLCRVVLPLCWRGLLSAVILSYARAISEFGAVIIIAYYPMTAPVKIYNLFLSFGLTQAITTSFVVLIVSLCVFLALRMVSRKRKLPA